MTVGSFGVHCIETGGIWSFTGSVPRNIKPGGYETEAQAVAAFGRWFKQQDAEWQLANVDHLRGDVLDHLLF